MAIHNDFGKEAEQEAVIYLKNQGYEILERNFRYQHAEIDIIAKKETILAVVEVKARNSVVYGEPETFVNTQKKKLLAMATDYYIQKNDLELEVRFDIISIVKNKFHYSLKHIEDAFYVF